MAALIVLASIWGIALAAYIAVERRDPTRSDLSRVKRRNLPSARDRHAVGSTMIRAVRVPHPQL